MEIHSISNPFSSTTQTGMSESQKASLQEILSRYDTDNLTQADFDTMTNELREAGLDRNLDVKSMLEETGIDVSAFNKEGPGDSRSRPKPPPEHSGINVQSLQSLQEILKGYDLTNMSVENEEKLIEELMSSGLFQPGLILNTQA